jgi:hypothetical protein
MRLPLLLLSLVLRATLAGASESKVEEHLQAFWTAALWHTPVSAEHIAPVLLTKFLEDAKFAIAITGNTDTSFRNRALATLGAGDCVDRPGTRILGEQRRRRHDQYRAALRLVLAVSGSRLPGAARSRHRPLTAGDA